ncbi:MAG: amidase [Acidobacteria bacterium]|nr:amidase [Acidobacteriota bacterium]MCI0723658.1 amidase [Acidobacteriota bacterium]
MARGVAAGKRESWLCFYTTLKMFDLCYLSIAEAAERIHTRKLSPLELTQAHLHRIEQLDSQLRTFITLTAELAVQQARQATEELARAQVLGPLYGVPVTYKDMIATAGVRTTAGSRVYADWIPQKDATVVTRLRTAGAITLGKVTQSEFTFSGGTAEEDFVKPARNPWNPKYPTGGSSSGSAAGVAAGLAMGSIGGDSGGSVRIPAAYCGVTGLKPTYGRVSRAGVLPLSYSMDHLGPITRTVEDAAIVLQAISGNDEEDPTSSRQEVPPYQQFLSRNIRGLKMGICPSYMDAVGVDLEVLSAFEVAVKVFRGLGMSVKEVSVPHLNYACAAGYNTLMRVEAFHAHFKNLKTERGKYGVRTFRNIARGGFLSAQDYIRAQQARTLISNELAKAFESVDTLLMPTTPTAASPGTYYRQGMDEKVRQGSLTHHAAYTAPFNLTGSPVLSIPCGFNSAGMPMGVQLIGRAFDEATILAVGHQYQLATRWHLQRPPLDR